MVSIDMPGVDDAFLPVPLGTPGQVADTLLSVIRNCVRRVSESPELRAEALVLVGSMARGEASVLTTENGIECLSDMEFLLAVKNDRKAKHRMENVRLLTERVTADAAANGLRCSFEFSPTSTDYFRKARPCIFATEVRRHGRVVWGDATLLDGMPEGPIPKIDALNLVGNRMVEQLQWRTRICSGEGDEGTKAFAYSLLKTYVDLGTSLLVFADQYESTYARRADRLETLRDPISKEITNFDLLLDRIAANSEHKLKPTRDLLDRILRTEALMRWEELARFALRVWLWEVGQLAEGDCGDARAQVMNFTRYGTARERFRDWAKLARTAARYGNSSDLLRAGYLSGSPRHRLYAQAAVEYARLAGLESEFPVARSLGKNLLPIRSPRKLSPQDSVAEVIRIWETYLRNA